MIVIVIVCQQVYQRLARDSSLALVQSAANVSDITSLPYYQQVG